MNWIFKETDYHKVILEMIERSGNSHGIRSQLARAAGCQPAYFTQMLAGNVQLTPEHASSLIDYWQFDVKAAEYFLILVHLGRAGTESLRQKLLKQARAVANDALSTEQKIVDPVDQQQAALLYYSHWRISAIHMLLSVPKLQTVSALAAHLGMSTDEIEKILVELEKVGLASRQGERVIPTLKNLHAYDEALVSNLHHKNWRAHTQEIVGSSPEHFHYTSVCTLSEKDFHAIRKILKESVEETNKVIDPSEEQIGACLAIDWYKI